MRTLVEWLTVMGLAVGISTGLVASPAGSGHRDSAEPRVDIIGSIHPLVLMASAFADDQRQIHELLPPGQEPHHVSLTFSQRRLLDSADLVLWVGSGLETYLVKALATRDPQTVLPFAPEGVSFHSDTEGSGHEQGVDPHLWLNPELVRDYMSSLHSWLVAQYPQRARETEQAHRRFEAALAEKTGEIRTRLALYQGKTFIAEHDAYSHFTRYFGLTSAGSLSDSSDVAVGARSLAQLMAAQEVSCVVVEQLPGGKRARQLAARLEVPVVAVDPLGSTVTREQGYVGLLEAVTAGFERCFDAGLAD